MPSKKLLLILCTCASFSTAIWAKSTNLLLSTDVDCRLSIDGKAKGILQDRRTRRVSLAVGEYRLEAVYSQRRALGRYGEGRWAAIPRR